MWSDSATIGFNAASDRSDNYILSGLPIVDDIACIDEQMEWKNIIYNLEINTVILATTPSPPAFIGKLGYS